MQAMMTPVPDLKIGDIITPYHNRHAKYKVTAIIDGKVKAENYGGKYDGNPHVFANNKDYFYIRKDVK